MNPIASFNPMTYYGVYSGILAQGGQITDDAFKVQIPQLMPNMPAGAPKASTVSVDYSKVLTTNYNKSKATIANRNYFDAETATYFRKYHFGNVLVMSRSIGQTEPSKGGQWTGACAFTGAPHIQNWNDIRKPHQFFDMYYQDLNDIPTVYGDKAIIAVTSFAEVYVLHIPKKLQKEYFKY